jgi:hypothetical protein
MRLELRPRLGILHFTLMLVFVPLGSPSMAHATAASPAQIAARPAGEPAATTVTVLPGRR